jgi:hypothetical protein
MPNPIEMITKPLQIAFSVIGSIQKLIAGEQHAEPPAEPPKPPRAKPKAKPLDDVTITRKVETILFRDESVNKGKVNVNTADGVVSLRGEAKTPELIKELEAKAREIPEVKDVENLLHLPKTPARMSSGKKANPRKRAPKRVTSERKKAPLGP